jgi:aspartyl-tRNA(Asn)/glutamyl-tRNA(Gln) amidotransferase subunit C
MALDQNTVRTIANLARLAVPEDEVAHLAGELSNIIGFIEQLAEVDTKGVAPMTSVAHLELPQRADVVTDGDCRDKVLSNAPEREDGFFLVPRVVE